MTPYLRGTLDSPVAGPILTFESWIGPVLLDLPEPHELVESTSDRITGIGPACICLDLRRPEVHNHCARWLGVHLGLDVGDGVLWTRAHGGWELCSTTEKVWFNHSLSRVGRIGPNVFGLPSAFGFPTRDVDWEDRVGSLDVACRCAGGAIRTLDAQQGEIL